MGMSDLETLLAAVPPAPKPVHTLRRADESIPDLPRRLVAALGDGTLTLARSLEAPAGSTLTFGWVAVVRWLGELPTERLAGVPPHFFEVLLDDAEKQLRTAAAMALAGRFPREALPALERLAAAEAPDRRDLAAALGLQLVRAPALTPDDALRAMPVLERLASALRGQGKKDAKDAADSARKLVQQGLDAAFTADDPEAVARFLQGAEVDSRMPGELSQHFTLLSVACARGARRVATLLLSRGADPVRAALGLARSTFPNGLELLLELAPLGPEALSRALDTAVLAPFTQRPAQVRLLAERLPSLDVSHSIEPGLPLAATLARLGLLDALEGKPEEGAIRQPIAPEVVAALLTRGIRLEPGARLADVVPAARRSLEQRLEGERRRGAPSLEDLERVESLSRCEEWLRGKGWLATKR